MQESSILKEVPTITEIARTALQAITVHLVQKNSLYALQATTVLLNRPTQLSAQLAHTIPHTTQNPHRTLIA